MTRESIEGTCTTPNPGSSTSFSRANMTPRLRLLLRRCGNELANLDAIFKNDIFPVLTPIAIDPGHPFPHLRNKSLNLGVMFARENDVSEPGFGVVQVPAMLPRVIPVKLARARIAFVLLEDLIARHVHEIFPVLRLRG